MSYLKSHWPLLFLYIPLGLYAMECLARLYLKWEAKRNAIKDSQRLKWQ